MRRECVFGGCEEVKLRLEIAGSVSDGVSFGRNLAHQSRAYVIPRVSIFFPAAMILTTTTPFALVPAAFAFCARGQDACGG